MDKTHKIAILVGSLREGSINRPALALTGFFKYFANKRIQVMGAAEMTYLRTLSPTRGEGCG